MWAEVIHRGTQRRIGVWFCFKDGCYFIWHNKGKERAQGNWTPNRCVECVSSQVRAGVSPAGSHLVTHTHSFPRAERSLPRWGSAGSTATAELRGRAAARGLRREAALPRTHHGTVDRWIPLRISDTQLWQDPRRGSSNGSRTMLCETVLAKSHRGASQKILRSFLSYLW